MQGQTMMQGQPMMGQPMAPQYTEEQLKRMYKGVEFRSEEEKDQIIEMEKAAEEYCNDLSNKTYKELFEKNQEWSKLPSQIFMPFTIKLMSEIGGKEAAEIEAYKAKIANITLEEVEPIRVEITEQHYSDAALSNVFAVLYERKRTCQVNVLEQEFVGYTSLSRTDLQQLREKVNVLNFEADIVSAYINKINIQYDVVEQNELQNMCANVDNMQMNELEGIMRMIVNGGYQEKFTAPYITMINNRIEVLQYQELENLTAGKENMDKAALMALYQQLEQGGYNQKFVKRFLVDVRMLIENRKYNEIAAMTANVGVSDAATVEAVSQSVEQSGCSSTILCVPRQKIAEKKFEFEMNELIDTCNNFDMLTNEQADSLIMTVREKNVSDMSKSIYLDKIAQRKYNIALSEVNKLSAFFVQTANKYGIGGDGILVASKSDAFMNAYRSLKAAYPNSGEYDVPAFIMSSPINLSVSYRFVYLNAGNKQALVDVNNINGFRTVKKLFAESLVLELRDGTSIPVSGSVNKQILPVFTQMLNEFIVNVNNKVYIDSFGAPVFNVEPLDKSVYDCSQRTYQLTTDTIKVLTINDMCANPLMGEMAKAMHFEANKDWEQYQMKVKANYPVQADEKLLFVYDKTLLNSAKEGFAVGENAIYVKKGSNPVYAIAMKDVFAVKCDPSGRMFIETTGLDIIALDMVTASPNAVMYMASKIDEYVNAMQLYGTLYA